MYQNDASCSDPPAVIRVALAGGHASTRGALRDLLDEQPSLSVVSAVQTLEELLPAPEGPAQDLVLLDVRLPDAGTILGARDFRRLSPRSGLVLHTTHVSAEAMVAAVIANASGHVVKTLDGSALARSLAGIHYRESPTPRVGSRLVRWYQVGLACGRPGFAADELALLRLIAAGHSDLEITEQLQFDQSSLYREVERLYAALSSRPDLRGPGAQLAQLLGG